MAVALCAIVFAPAAHAAFAGENGDVAVTVDQECDGETVSSWTFDPDTGEVTDFFFAAGYPAWSPDGNRVASSTIESGGILVQAVGGPAQEIHSSGTEPAWSPDGTRLTFADFDDLAIINADGSGFQVLLTGQFIRSPKWSPDGTRIAFSAVLDGETDHEIYVLELATGDVTKLTDNTTGDDAPDWSPDGSQLTFHRAPGSPSQTAVHRMNADGSGQTPALATGTTPAWSPGATRIVFARNPNIYSMAPDGSDEQFELDGSGYCIDNPDWQPLPVNTASTHLRPKGATPIYASLVTAFKPCGSSNRTHGPPLAHASCNPPVPESPNLAISVGETQLRAIGSLRARVLAGTPGGPDDTDVQLIFSLTNVMKASDHSEYTGEVQARIGSRVTDKEGPASSTTQDFPLSWSVPCAPTADPQIASACTSATTLDAVLPGAAAEGTRAIWAFDAVEVHDGGPDGDAHTLGDNSLFMKQGVFVP